MPPRHSGGRRKPGLRSEKNRLDPGVHRGDEVWDVRQSGEFAIHELLTAYEPPILFQQRPGAREHVIDYVPRCVFHEARSPLLECNNPQLRAHDDALGCGTGAGQRHREALQPIEHSTLGNRRDEAQPEAVKFLDR